MQCKKIEKIAPVKPTGDKKHLVTAQKEGNILILDVYRDKIHQGRQAINTETGEYAQYDPNTGKWYHRKFAALLEDVQAPYWYHSDYEINKRVNPDTPETQKMIKEALKELAKVGHYGNPANTYAFICSAEYVYSWNKRQRVEDNRVMRVQEKMRLVPDIPEDVRQWIWKMQGAENYIFRREENGEWRWTCSACRKSFHQRYLHREDGEKKIRHNDRVICPKCKAVSQAKTRVCQVQKKTHFYMAQRIHEQMSVFRHFNATITWTSSGREIKCEETIRYIMYDLGAKYAGELFYNQNKADGWLWPKASFDTKNPAQHQARKGYLYPEGLQEALKGTAYQGCAQLAGQLAAAGIPLNYNRLLMVQSDPTMIGVAEYLFKGRFWRLLEQFIENIGTAYCPTDGNAVQYYGKLNPSGKNIEEIFMIRDHQLINRIRDINGDEGTLLWMRLSDRKGIKINQETLEWLNENHIDPEDIGFLKGRMSPQQIMHYIRRQQAEEYKNLSAQSVLGQWADYMNMLKQLGKKTDDEMMYRPRQLKRRHDECVEEINAQRIRQQMCTDSERRAQEAKKMRERFPGAEEVLKEIREKYAFEDDQYIIKVPESLMDIITEGQALHHCAGATDRYFDRIMQRETYICFLRRKSDPDTPYYTIEVEPGGTIRQHRGYLDEEPNIEQIKPFLRKWQQEIKKRMTQEDRQHAATSAIKRKQNIEELKANRNTRVLRGLMEDFMSAEDVTEFTEQLLAAGS